ncbi:MAG TPA: ArsA family ATPase [Syntrophales bacterium]|nr:ArsA family ATPase [Syntrophales bacterium]HOM06529.1 ArsA family ATPase [Syntrophales bacterium]HON99914.1 ArsA family ATPase [Syntrophales bacterium]HPC00641.1 ArsA family ATPase [Syntrophales bacterium]HPQ06209.1 ArsA family ATPase [Syntrophales bacterium]
MRVVFFTGKGGVGKSTLAAAAARQLSRRHRVLLVSLDPAHNIGDIFGIDLAGGRRRLDGNLTLAEVDLGTMAREYLEGQSRALADTYRYLTTLNLERYFSVLKYSPGIEEYALLTSIERTVREGGDLDYVLFDTPPTGLTLRFLALPQVTTTWIERLAAIRRQILEKRYTIGKITKEDGRTAGVRLAFDEDEDEIMRRLKTLRENYGALSALLRGEGTAMVLVCNPDLLSLRESRRLVDGFADLGLPLRLVVLNKVPSRDAAVAAEVEERLREMAGRDKRFLRVPLDEEIAGGRRPLYEIDAELEDFFVF